MLDTLLESGAVVDSATAWSGIHAAVVYERGDLIPVLARRLPEATRALPSVRVPATGTVLELEGTERETTYGLLTKAVAWGRIEATRQFLALGMPAEGPPDATTTPLQWAAFTGRVAEFDLLRAAGADPTRLDVRLASGRSLVQHADENGWTQIASRIRAATGPR